MQNLKTGMMVLILDSLLHDGKKAQIMSVTDTKVVVEVYDFFDRKTIELAPEQVAVLDQIEHTTEGPFHTGDRVFLYESAYGQAKVHGQVGEVIRVFPAWQKCLVKREDEEDDKLYLFSDISLIMPERRLPDEDYLRAIAQAVQRRVYLGQYDDWWQQQADKKLWSIDELPELYAASLEFETQLNAEIAAETERQSQLLEQTFSGLTHAQKVEKWQAEWYSWTEYRSSSKELTPEEKLLKAIFGEDEPESEETEQEDHPETPEEQGRDYSYRNSGSELLERCQKHMERLAQPETYSYDTVPFRAIAEETATDTSTTFSFQPTLPQTSPQPTEPLILPGQEQAIALLKDEGEHFIAALARLASTADDATIALLLEQYEDLQAREGFDNRRYYLIQNLELALLATQHKETVETVLQKKLDSWLLGNGLHNTYEIQGIKFKGSAHPFYWNEENAWNIRANEEIQATITRIWASVIHTAPQFVALLSEYTLGLVLFKLKETGENYLGYLHMVPFTQYECAKHGLELQLPTDTSVNQLVAWLGQGDCCLLLGRPPRDPNDDRLEKLPDFRLPLALRELYAIHSGLDGNGGHDIRPPQGLHKLMSWIGEEDKFLLDRFHARTLALLPKQFIDFAPDIFGNTYVFDLDSLDERLDPQIADWDHETWEISKREPFWQWFADFAPRSLLGLNEENLQR